MTVACCSGSSVKTASGTEICVPEVRVRCIRWHRHPQDPCQRNGPQDRTRAQETKAGLRKGLAKTQVHGRINAVTAEHADIVLVALSYDAQESLLGPLRDAVADETVLNCVNAPRFDKLGAMYIADLPDSLLMKARNGTCPGAVPGDRCAHWCTPAISPLNPVWSTS